MAFMASIRREVEAISARGSPPTGDHAQPDDVLGAALQVVATVEYLLADGVSVRAFAFAVRCLKADNVPEAEWLNRVRLCMTRKIAWVNHPPRPAILKAARNPPPPSAGPSGTE